MNKKGSQFFCDSRLLRKLQIGQKLPYSTGVGASAKNAKILHFPQIVTIYNSNLFIQLLFFGLVSPLCVCLTDQTAALAIYVVFNMPNIPNIK